MKIKLIGLATETAVWIATVLVGMNVANSHVHSIASALLVGAAILIAAEVLSGATRATFEAFKGEQS